MFCCLITAHIKCIMQFPTIKMENNLNTNSYLSEPFDLTNTARSVYDEEVFKRVRKVFMDSYKLLDETRDLSAILGETNL